MAKRWLVGIALLLGLGAGPRAASAQVVIGQWLQKGVSGIAAEGAVTVARDNTELSVSAGFSYKGVLDLSGGLHYVTYNSDSALGDGASAIGVEPTLAFHPLKQAADMPVSIALAVGVPILAVHSDALMAQDLQAHFWGVDASAAAYRFFRLSPTIGVTPSAGLRAGYAKATIDNSFGDQIRSSSDSFFAGALTGYFAFLTDGGAIIGVAPTLSLVGASGNTSVSFSVSLGVVLPRP